MVSLALRAIFGIEHRPVPVGLHAETVCGFLFMPELSWSYCFFPSIQFFLLNIIIPIFSSRFKIISRVDSFIHSELFPDVLVGVYPHKSTNLCFSEQGSFFDANMRQSIGSITSI